MGQLFTWGRNGDGELGIGNTDDSSSPIQVGTGSDSNFRFCDADAFASFEVAGAEKSKGMVKFGKDNAKIAEEYNDCIFKKTK